MRLSYRIWLPISWFDVLKYFVADRQKAVSNRSSKQFIRKCWKYWWGNLKINTLHPRCLPPALGRRNRLLFDACYSLSIVSNQGKKYKFIYDYHYFRILNFKNYFFANEVYTVIAYLHFPLSIVYVNINYHTSTPTTFIDCTGSAYICRQKYLIILEKSQISAFKFIRFVGWF